MPLGERVCNLSKAKENALLQLVQIRLQ